MAMQEMAGYRGDETMAGFHAIFVDTSLDTNLALSVSDVDTVWALKHRVALEHSKCFPKFGDVKVHALKIRRKANHYHLSDLMLVKTAFHGVSKTWFILADISSKKKPNILPAPLPTNSPHALEYPQKHQDYPTKCPPTLQMTNCKDDDANFRTSSSESGRRPEPHVQKEHDFPGEVNEVPAAVDDESKKNHTKSRIMGVPSAAALDEEESLGSRTTGRKGRRKNKVTRYKLTSGADDAGNEQTMIISSMGPSSEDKTALEIKHTTLGPFDGGNEIIQFQANEIKENLSEKEGRGNDNRRKRKSEAMLDNTLILPKHDASVGTLAEPTAAPVEAADENASHGNMIFQDGTDQHTCSDSSTLSGYRTQKDRRSKELSRFQGMTDSDYAENGTEPVGGAPEAGMNIVKKRRKMGDDAITNSDYLPSVDKSGDLEGGICQTELPHTSRPKEASENHTKPSTNKTFVPNSKEVKNSVKRSRKRKKAKVSRTPVMNDDETHELTGKYDTKLEANDDKEPLQPSQVHEGEREAENDCKNDKMPQNSARVYLQDVSARSESAKTTSNDQAIESGKNQPLGPLHVLGAIHSGLGAVMSTEDENISDKPGGKLVKAGFERGALGLSHEVVVSEDPRAEMESAVEHSGTGRSKLNWIGSSGNNIGDQGLGETVSSTEVRNGQPTELQEINRNSKTNQKTKKQKAPSNSAESRKLVPLQPTTLNTSEEDKKHGAEKCKRRSIKQQALDVGKIPQPLLKEHDAADVKLDGSELDRSDGLPISESDVRGSAAMVDDKAIQMKFSDKDGGDNNKAGHIHQSDLKKSKRPTKKQQTANPESPLKSSPMEQDAKGKSDEAILENLAVLPSSECDVNTSRNKVSDSAISQSCNPFGLERETNDTSQSKSESLFSTQFHGIEEESKGSRGKNKRSKKHDSTAGSLPSAQGTKANPAELEPQRSVAVPKLESEMKNSKTRTNERLLISYSCSDGLYQTEAEGTDQRNLGTVQATPVHGIKVNAKSSRSEKPKRRTKNQQGSDLKNLSESSLSEQESKAKADGLELESSVAKKKNKSSAPQSGLKPSNSSKDVAVPKPPAVQRKSYVIQRNNSGGDGFRPLSATSDPSKLNHHQGNKVAQQVPVKKELPSSIVKSSSKKMSEKNLPQKETLIDAPGLIFSEEGSSSSDEGEENEEKVSDGSTETPSDHASSSEDYSEGESKGNWVSQKQDVTKDDGEAISNSQSSARKNLSLECMLKKSSNFKKTKLVASQSQVEDSVPDSQGNM